MYSVVSRWVTAVVPPYGEPTTSTRAHQRSVTTIRATTFHPDRANNNNEKKNVFCFVFKLFSLT